MSRACGGASCWVLCACLAAAAEELPVRSGKGDGEQCGLWGMSATELHAGECAEGFLCPPLEERREIPLPSTCQPVLGKGEGDNSQACRVVVELDQLVGPNIYAGSETGATISFNIGGEWTQERPLFQRVEDSDEYARQGEVLTAAYWLMAWPRQIRLTAGGDDAFGYKKITLVLPDGNRMSVIWPKSADEDLSYPTSEDSPGYRHWIDGNEIAPETQIFDVGQDIEKKWFEAQPTPAPTAVTTSITTTSSATSTSVTTITTTTSSTTSTSVTTIITTTSSTTSTSATSTPYDCDAGFNNWQAGWSTNKKQWCCDNEDKGCTVCPPGYRQVGEVGDDVPSWGLTQGGILDCKTECDERADCGSFDYTHNDKGRGDNGCSWNGYDTSTTSAQTSHVDGMLTCAKVCPPGYRQVGEVGDDVPSWGLAQGGILDCKTQCDERADCGSFEYTHNDKGRGDNGCSWNGYDISTTSAQTSHVDGMLTCAKMTSSAISTSVATITTTGSTTSTSHRGDDELEFSCQEGYARWETGWSVEKKAWCCRERMVGCAFDCGEDLDQWKTAWSPEKKDYCCKAEGVGCEFDCKDFYSNPEAGYSDEKKEYCCTNEMAGCKYDCWADSDRMDDWPTDKREWCCDWVDRGCLEDSTGASRRELHLLADGPTGPQVPPRQEEGAVLPGRLPGVVTTVAGCLLVVLVVGSCMDIARRRQRALAGYRQPVAAGDADAERSAA